MIKVNIVSLGPNTCMIFGSKTENKKNGLIDALVLHTNIFSFLCFRIFFAGAVNWNYETNDVV